MDLKEQLELQIDALIPILYFQTYEDMEIVTLLNYLKKMGKKVEVWEVTQENETLEEFLYSFASGIDSLEDVVLVIKDIHFFFDESKPNYPKIVSLLKKIAIKILTDEDSNGHIILTSPKLKVPFEIEKYLSIFEIPFPDNSKIENLIQKFAEIQEENISDKEIKTLSQYFKGLTEIEITILLNLIYTNGSFGTKESKKFILEEKKQIIKKGQILEMIETKETLDDIGGLENLKEWLKQKAKVFANIKEAQKFGVDIPKGVFIVGMPGCGKSLTAKATSILFNNIPLLRLDIGKLMGKYVGESEENMRKAIYQIEAISPAILWIDEIEKAFSGINQGGSEVTTRLFGFFLTWMQEKKSEVFVIATANDITNLPPELLRRGRFDEVFFVDFPNEKERKDIFKLHILNRKHKIDGLNLKSLASMTKGYSGADIEAIVKDSIEKCFVENKKLSDKILFEVIENTPSISETLKKSIDYYTKIKKEFKMKLASKK